MLNTACKTYIETLYNAGVRGPKKMLSCLMRENREGKLEIDEVPKLHQIKYYLCKTRDTTAGTPVLSLGELEKWCIENTPCPTDPNQPFVISHKICYGEVNGETEKRFWYLVSSKKLLEVASKSNVLCADSTYKLLRDGFPVPFFGTVDANKHFKPLFIGVASNETRSTYREMFDVSNNYIKK